MLFLPNSRFLFLSKLKMLRYEQNVSGLAVIDDHGHLMGTLGSRDVKGLVAQGPLDLTRLRLTTREYINFIKQLSLDVILFIYYKSFLLSSLTLPLTKICLRFLRCLNQEKHPAISVRRIDTMTTLIGKFSSTHVHRFACNFFIFEISSETHRLFGLFFFLFFLFFSPQSQDFRD